MSHSIFLLIKRTNIVWDEHFDQPTPHPPPLAGFRLRLGKQAQSIQYIPIKKASQITGLFVEHLSGLA